MKMKNRYCLLILAFVLMFSFTISISAQEMERKPRLMIVDETETFEFAMRVQGLVGAMRNRADIEILTKTVSVDYPTENPLKGEEDLSVDAVIVVPHSIETGHIKQIWIITRPFSSLPVEMRAQAEKMMEGLKDGIRRAFSGKVEPVGVNDDLIPVLFSALFMKEGILR